MITIQFCLCYSN